MLTDNRILVERAEDLPALMCVQRKAAKKVVTEEDAIKSNIDSFGDDIGKTTNWITSMFDVRSQFEPGNREYEELSYRIQCGQLFQQNSIDKSKGIIAKPMPREWHDRHSVNMIEDADKRQFYLSIVADKKPYFMKYIYPTLSRQLNTYTRNANKNALREFGMSVEELLDLPQSGLTEEQSNFLRYYDSRMPTSNNDCVMNRICRRFEQEFDGYLGRHNADVDFDYTVMKSDTAYAPSQYRSILQLYGDYNHRVREYTVFAGYERIDKYDIAAQTSAMRLEFEQECDRICPNRAALCNILLDICYRRDATRKFAWDICGGEIISNLLKKSGGAITYPTRDDNGGISYCGKNFSLKTKVLEDNYEHSFE